MLPNRSNKSADNIIDKDRTLQGRAGSVYPAASYKKFRKEGFEVDLGSTSKSPPVSPRERDINYDFPGRGDFGEANSNTQIHSTCSNSNINATLMQTSKQPHSVSTSSSKTTTKTQNMNELLACVEGELQSKDAYIKYLEGKLESFNKNLLVPNVVTNLLKDGRMLTSLGMDAKSLIVEKNSELKNVQNVEEKQKAKRNFNDQIITEKFNQTNNNSNNSTCSNLPVKLDFYDMFTAIKVAGEAFQFSKRALHGSGIDVDDSSFSNRDELTYNAREILLNTNNKKSRSNHHHNQVTSTTSKTSKSKLQKILLEESKLSSNFNKLIDSYDQSELNYVEQKLYKVENELKECKKQMRKYKNQIKNDKLVNLKLHSAFKLAIDDCIDLSKQIQYLEGVNLKLEESNLVLRQKCQSLVQTQSSPENQFTTNTPIVNRSKSNGMKEIKSGASHSKLPSSQSYKETSSDKQLGKSHYIKHQHLRDRAPKERDRGRERDREQLDPSIPIPPIYPPGLVGSDVQLNELGLTTLDDNLSIDDSLLPSTELDINSTASIDGLFINTQNTLILNQTPENLRNASISPSTSPILNRNIVVDQSDGLSTLDVASCDNIPGSVKLLSAPGLSANVGVGRDSDRLDSSDESSSESSSLTSSSVEDLNVDGVLTNQHSGDANKTNKNDHEQPQNDSSSIAPDRKDVTRNRSEDSEDPENPEDNQDLDNQSLISELETDIPAVPIPIPRNRNTNKMTQLHNKRLQIASKLGENFCPSPMITAAGDIDHAVAPNVDGLLNSRKISVQGERKLRFFWGGHVHF